MDDPRRAMTEDELETQLQRQAPGMVGMLEEQRVELAYQSHRTLGDLVLDLLGEDGER